LNIPADLNAPPATHPIFCFHGDDFWAQGLTSARRFGIKLGYPTESLVQEDHGDVLHYLAKK
jgi:hypothetical protein